MSIISRGKKWVAGLAIAAALFGVSLAFVPPATANTDQQIDADAFDADAFDALALPSNLPSMRWQFSSVFADRYYKVISDIGSRCLDVDGGSLQPGAKIQIYRCTSDSSNPAQIWAIQ